MAVATLLNPILNIAPAPNEAPSLIALLEEENLALKAHALKCLYEVVDRCWSDVAGAVPLIEALSEEEGFSARELAAAVASKCFFPLGGVQRRFAACFGCWAIL